MQNPSPANIIVNFNIIISRYCCVITPPEPSGKRCNIKK